MTSRKDPIGDVVTEAVAWERGVGHEWGCDGIIGSPFLSSLVDLAEKAPLEDREDFIQRWKNHR